MLWAQHLLAVRAHRSIANHVPGVDTADRTHFIVVKLIAGLVVAGLVVGGAHAARPDEARVLAGALALVTGPPRCAGVTEVAEVLLAEDLVEADPRAHAQPARIIVGCTLQVAALVGVDGVECGTADCAYQWHRGYALLVQGRVGRWAYGRSHVGCANVCLAPQGLGCTAGRV